MNPAIRLLFTTITTLFALVGVQSVASAQLLAPSNVRCAGATSVSTAQATARYQWALNCRTNLPTPPPGQTYSPDQWLTPQSITDHDNPVNASFIARMYPVYFNFLFGTTWDAPDSATAACSLRPDTANNAGLCVSGCYMEDTQLQFAEGPIGIKSAFELGKVDLVTLAPTATLDNLQYVNNRVERYTTDLTEEWQVIYTLAMSSGGALRVTDEHPLLTSDGIIRQAQSLRVGDKLLRANGKPDPIVKIEVNRVFSKVYNVKPVTLDYTTNIVVAGGYLNGSVRYQNEFLDTINSLILRRALTDQAGRFTGK